MSKSRKIVQKTTNNLSRKKSDKIVKNIASNSERNIVSRFFGLLKLKITNVLQRRNNFIKRRPHRSFILTRRRDYKRQLEMPGYFAFTIEVSRLIWTKKWLFLRLILVFIVLVVIFGLMGRQDIYDQLYNTLDETAPESVFGGTFGGISKAGVILLTSVTSGLTPKMDSGQIIIASLLGLYIWLTTVWLLRKIVAGKRVVLRDGLYNAGSPILPTMLTLLILLIQIVPGALAALVAGAAWQSGLIEGGAFSMLTSVALALIIVLSLYWMVSTFLALVVVTLPGMYPLRAIAIAGDLVIGRRLRLMYRIIWMFLVIVSWWIVIMIPVILFDGWIKSIFSQISWMPTVPIFMLIMSIITIVWVCVYIYLLYRKVVDDGTAPS
jgi:hypothetical protein